MQTAATATGLVSMLLSSAARYALLGLCLLLGMAALHGQAQDLQSLAFVPNRGQWKGNFAYKADLPAISLFLNPDGLRVHMAQEIEHGHKHVKNHGPALPKGFAWQMRFVGADGQAKATEQGHLPQKINYLQGRNPKAYVQGISPATSVSFANIYPGIAAQWLQAGGAAFHLHAKPGADLSSIKLAFDGIEKGVQAAKNGDLVFATPLGEVRLTAPKAWQVQGQEQLPLACQYAIVKGIVSFHFPQGYDPSLPVVIDPTLVFSSYSGSSADNWGNTATYDRLGRMYIGGIVFSRGYPTTLGALDTSFAGSVDAGLLRFSANGKRLEYATYLGGAFTETPHSMVVGSDFSLYVMGSTSSPDFPTSRRGFDTTFAGGPTSDPMGYSFVDYYYPNGSDFFIAKLDSSGGRLLGSTFMGGTGNDAILDQPQTDQSNLTRNYGDQFKGEIILDKYGRVCVVGSTASPDFPMRNGFDASYNGEGDAVLFRLSPSLDRLINATYFGSTQQETGYGLAQDSVGRTYIVGGTRSSLLPGTAGTIAPSNHGGKEGYIARIDSNWADAPIATYVGTNADDVAYLVQTDRNGTPYAIGQTNGAYPISAGVYSNPAGGQFIHCFSPDLRSTRFSTRFGGTANAPDIVVSAFLVDDCGKIYASGWGGITNDGSGYIAGSTAGMPTTANAVQRTTDGSDYYLIVLEPNATALHYATFIGADNTAHGEHVDGGTSRFDKRGVVYQAVCGCGGSIFPTTAGVYGPENLSGNCNSAGFKFDFSQLQALGSVLTPSGETFGCAPLNFRLRNKSQSATSSFWLVDGQLLNRQDSAFNLSFARPGTFKITLKALNAETCRRVDSVDFEVSVFKAKAKPDTTFQWCASADSLQMNNLSLAGYQYEWTGPNLTNDARGTARPFVRPAQGNNLYTCKILSAEGCLATRKVRVLDRRLEASIALPDTGGCAPFALPLKANTTRADSLRWHFADGTPAGSATTQNHSFARQGTYSLVLVATSDSACTRLVSDTIQVSVNDVRLLPDSNLRLCNTGDSLRLANFDSTGYRFLWQGLPLSVPDTAAQPVVLPSGAATYSCIVTSAQGCARTRRVKVADGRLEAKIITADTLGCAPYPVAATIAGYQIKSQTWSFGDISMPNTADSVRHTYQPGSYWLRLTARNDSACAPLVQDSIRIVASSVAIAADTTLAFCAQGDTIRLASIVGAGYTYLWRGPGLGADSLPGQELVARPPARGAFYTSTVRNALGCTQQRIVKVVDHSFRVQAFASSNRLCTTSSLSLLAQARPVATAYTWQIGGQQLPDSTIGLRLPPGQYTAKVVAQNDTTCARTATDSIRIDIAAPPIYASTTYQVCPADTLTLKAPQGQFYSYSWVGGFNSSPSYPISAMLDTSSFYVDVTDNYGCLSRKYFYLRPDSISAAFSLDTSYSPCTNFSTIVLRAYATDFTSLAWQRNGSTFATNDPSPTIATPDKGLQTITLQAQKRGCTATQSQTANLLGRPAKIALAFSNQIIYDQCGSFPLLALQNQSTGGQQYLFLLGPDTLDAAKRIRLRTADPQTLRLLATDRGCEASMVKTISAPSLIVPNVVTANGDNVNENLQLPAPSTNPWRLEIRNRWGKLAYRTSGYANDWPKAETASGTYFYNLRSPDGANCTGWVEVVR